MDATSANPLERPSQEAWDRLIASANPPALLVAIRGLLGPQMRSIVEPEDVLQDTLLCAWRDRANCEWRGVGAFRRWLLQIAQHRICDLADHASAAKRGLHRELRIADLAADSEARGNYAGPQATTTPSRAASDRETADQLQKALEEVPEEWREVVRLRLFEELDFADIAARTGLGIEGVRYRFRHGAEAYRLALRRRRVLSTSHPKT